MSRPMSYRRYKVVLSLALSAVPRSQVGLAFLPCSFLGHAVSILDCCRNTSVLLDAPDCLQVPSEFFYGR
jgi:hypothetical protein